MKQLSNKPGTLVNLIIGGFGVGLLIWFVGGLALSIGETSFGVIAIIVLALAIIDYVQTVRNPD